MRFAYYLPPFRTWANDDSGRRSAKRSSRAVPPMRRRLEVTRHNAARRPLDRSPDLALLEGPLSASQDSLITGRVRPTASDWRSMRGGPGGSLSIVDSTVWAAMLGATGALLVALVAEFATAILESKKRQAESRHRQEDRRLQRDAEERERQDTLARGRRERTDAEYVKIVVFLTRVEIAVRKCVKMVSLLERTSEITVELREGLEQINAVIDVLIEDEDSLVASRQVAQAELDQGLDELRVQLIELD